MSGVQSLGGVPRREIIGRGHLEVVKVLVAAGANVHAEDDKALCWATARRPSAICAGLIHLFFNLEFRYNKTFSFDRYNNTPTVAPRLLSVWYITTSLQCTRGHCCTTAGTTAAARHHGTAPLGIFSSSSSSGHAAAVCDTTRVFILW